MELKAYQAYRNPDLSISFWRTSTGREVDFIMGDKELAIEIKGSSRVHEGDIGSLPWRLFLERLWSGEFD